MSDVRNAQCALRIILVIMFVHTLSKRTLYISGGEVYVLDLFS